MDLMDYCRKASEASLAEGTYGRKGWFTCLDVRRCGLPRHMNDLKDLQALVIEGRLVEGAWEDQLAIGTSACIFRLAEEAVLKVTERSGVIRFYPAYDRVVEVNVRNTLDDESVWVPARFVRQSNASGSDMVVIIDAPEGHSWASRNGTEYRCPNFEPWVREVCR